MIIGFLATFSLFGESVNLGEFPSNHAIKHIFYIKNTSQTKKMLLKGVRSSCTCADIKYSKSLLSPNESTQLIVTLKENSLSGAFVHTIYVETDSKQQRFMKFVIKGSAVPLLQVNPNPLLYIGTLQIGKRYEFNYDLIPNTKEVISKVF